MGVAISTRLCLCRNSVHGWPIRTSACFGHYISTKALRALILDTMAMVSVFAFLGVLELVLAALLLLAGLLIILARVGRAGAPKRQLLSI